MSSSDFRRMDADALAKLGDRMGRCLAEYVVKNCANCPMCKNFNFVNETCKLNNQRPPANVIAFGCELYEP